MPTIQFGKQSLPRETLKADKKGCRKIGPVGMGRRAMYLNSFYISRLYYALWTDIGRVYKLVAMTRGGFTGIGAFGAMSYLVVELRDGRTKKCQFKYEAQADQALAWIADNHPEIPTKSAAAEKRLRDAEAAEQAKRRDDLSVSERNNIRILEEARQYLEAKPDLYRTLQQKAGKKRAQQMVGPGRRALGITIFAVSAALVASGLPLAISGHTYGIYMIMFGGAFLIFSLSGNLVPIGSNSPKRVQREWDDAVAQCEAYIGKRESFPVPGRYAHPVVLTRMIRVIREGRAQEIPEALEVVKSDLKALNRSVKVSQEEYEEVVAVKAMFLVSDYR